MLDFSKYDFSKWNLSKQVEIVTLDFQFSEDTVDVPKKIVDKYLENLAYWYSHDYFGGNKTFNSFAKDLREYVAKKLNKDSNFTLFGNEKELPRIGV